MKKNKKLKQIAESNLKSYRKNDILYELIEIQQLQNNETSARVKRTNVWKRVAFSLTSVVTVVTVVLLCVFMIPIESKTQRYLSENELVNQSSVSELNSYLGDYLVKDSYLSKVVLVTDQLSGDKLYFRATFEDSQNFESATLLFIVNKYYQKSERQTMEELTYNGTVIQYSEIIINNDNVYEIKRYAIANIGNVKILVENYNKLSLEPEDDFNDFFDKIFA